MLVQNNILHYSRPLFLLDSEVYFCLYIFIMKKNALSGQVFAWLAIFITLCNFVFRGNPTISSSQQ